MRDKLGRAHFIYFNIFKPAMRVGVLFLIARGGKSRSGLAGGGRYGMALRHEGAGRALHLEG